MRNQTGRKLKSDIIVDHASELVTVAGASDRPKTGQALSELGIIKDGAVAIIGNTIADVDSSQAIHNRYDAENVISASNKTVLPGLVDPHTHLIFAPLLLPRSRKIQHQSFGDVFSQSNLGGI